MRTLLILAKKEFLQTLRDKFAFRVVLLMPIIQLLILPFAANMEVKNFSFVAIDHDHSQLSTRLVRKLEAGGYFQLKASLATWDEATRWVDEGRADMILEIPQHFERELILGQRPPLSVHISAINGLNASVGSGYLNSILGDYLAELAEERTLPAPPPAPALHVATQEWYNPHFDYKLVIVPGILALLITIMSVALTALNAVKEKERGTIEQLNVTPLSPAKFMLAKLLPFFLTGLLQFTIGLLIAHFIYGIPVVGNIGLLYGFVCLYMAGMLCFGFLISNLSTTQVQAIFTVFFFLIILILMSGLFTPVESMPLWAQRVDVINPIAHMISVVKMVLIKGSVAADLSRQWIGVGIFTLVSASAAIITFRKSKA